MRKRLALNYTKFLIILSCYGSKVSGSDPLDCDFEKGFCNWNQSKDDEIDWTRISGAASTNYTGPNGDHTSQGGYYAYIKTSSEKVQNKTRAWLTSQKKANGRYCFSLWYYMNGKRGDTLQVYKTDKNWSWQNVLTINGSQEQRWILTTMNVSSTSMFRIIIFGRFNYFNTRDYGIIAIDDLLMFPGSCPTECNDPTPTFGLMASKALKPGSVVEITCTSGYTLKGRSSIFCLANGSWSDNPECVPIDCLTPSIANGYIVSISNSTTFNSSIQLACDEGYRLKGSRYVTCRSDGNWSMLPTCFVINCSNPTPVSGYANSTNFQYKSQIEITCNPGYTILENSSILCQANGNWSNNPVCEPIDCFTPYVPHAITSGIVNRTTYNQTVMIDCADGYTLSGNRLVTCQSDGNWSSLPECLVQDSSSKPLTMLYVVGPVVLVILVIIILTILLRKVFCKNLTKNFCFLNNARKSKTQSGTFCNMTYSGHDIDTQSGRESNLTQDGSNNENTKTQNRNENNLFTVDCNSIDTVNTINVYENGDSTMFDNTGTESVNSTYSKVSKKKDITNSKSEYDTTETLSRIPKKVQSKEQTNKYDILKLNKFRKRREDETQNHIQEDLDPTYDHTHVDTVQINQNDYSHLMEIPLKSSESKEACGCEYVNAAVISEIDDEVCYENTVAFEERS